MKNTFFKNLMISSAALSASCGSDHVSFRHQSPNEDSASTASESSELAAEMNLTAAELKGLQTRVTNLKTYVAKTALPRLKEVNDICTSLTAQINALKSDLAEAGNEFTMLDQKKAGLDAVLERRLKDLKENKNQLAALEGKVAALKAAQRAIGPNLKKRLAQINREFSTQIIAKNQELKEVRLQMDGVVDSLPFDLARYNALEAQEDRVSSEIMILNQTLSEQTSILMDDAKQSNKSIAAELAAAEKQLALKKPGLVQRISDLRAAVNTLRAEISRVEGEIKNNTIAATLSLPSIPADCEAVLK